MGLFIALLVVFLGTRASAEGESSPDATSVLTMYQWRAFVETDAKLSSIVGKIGKPDRERKQDGLLVYTWYNRLDNNTVQKEDLCLAVIAYQNALIVVATMDPSGDPTPFPWTAEVMKAVLGPDGTQ